MKLRGKLSFITRQFVTQSVQKEIEAMQQYIAMQEPFLHYNAILCNRCEPFWFD